MLGLRRTLSLAALAAIALLLAPGAAAASSLQTVHLTPEGKRVAAGYHPGPGGQFRATLCIDGVCRHPMPFGDETIVNTSVIRDGKVRLMGTSRTAGGITNVVTSANTANGKLLRVCGQNGSRLGNLTDEAVFPTGAWGPSATGAVVVSGATVGTPRQATLSWLGFDTCALRPGVGTDDKGYVKTEFGNVNLPDEWLGWAPVGDGSFYAFGSEGRFLMGARAVVGKFDAKWNLSAALVHKDTPGIIDAFVAGRLFGGTLHLWAATGEHMCFDANLQDVSCTPAVYDFDSCDSRQLRTGRVVPAGVRAPAAGSLMIAGNCTRSGDNDLGLLAAVADGHDAGFGTGGKATYDAGAGRFPIPNAMAVSANGMLVAGDLLGPGGQTSFVLATDASGGGPELHVFDIPPDLPAMEIEEDVVQPVPTPGPEPGAGQPPPPAPGKCACTKLDAVVVPGTVKTLLVENKIDLDFRVEWQMTCSAGTTGACEGRLRIRPPRKPKFTQRLPKKAELVCKGDCGKVKGKRERFSLRTNFKAFTPRKRAGRTFKVAIDRFCGGTKLKPVTVALVFNRNGVVDRKKSDLNGNGKDDGSERKKPK